MMTVGRYLATRLKQLGAGHVFGLPGDFNLNLLDEILAADGLTWTGSANELNAAYSADGYARAGRRVGALVTTYGVGELSAINGTAGSFAEHVPVAHIVGMPPRAALLSGARVHHSLLDGDHYHFVRMFDEVTAAQVVLGEDPASAIDDILSTMLTKSRPVYIGVPLDVAQALVSSDRLHTKITPAASDPAAVAAFESALRARLDDVPGVVLLVGHGVHRRGLEPDIETLAGFPGVRIATQAGAKAILDEGHPASLGTYFGAETLTASTRRLVDEAALLVMVGTAVSDFMTGFFTHGYTPENAVELALDHARIGHAVYPGVRLADSLASLRLAMAETKFTPVSGVKPDERDRPTGRRPQSAPLDQQTLWQELQEWLEPDTIVIAEAGTAFYGALDLTLPERSDLLGQPVWSSIGYTIPATLGAALARPDRRPVLLVGDGAAQLTVQEFGRLFGQDNKPVVFLLDNDGYTVERKIQSPDASYQDIVRWDWSLVPRALGAAGAQVHDVRTVGELRASLRKARDRTAGHFVRLRLNRHDAPRLLLALAAGITGANREARPGSPRH
ncbi:alpha-keto acid decarboxylase family protein [Actinacidiphila sp. bgisy144]|uniref:alpha-keto acid decarboxylase family protein n=1 Tax=Actinacidiphila sp. bgisy144 TaxID=3413791 RepID=UPI003EBDE0C4